MEYGVKHLTYCDRNGILNRDTAMNSSQLELCDVTNLENAHGTLADALKGADAANYKLTAQPADVTADITPKAVTVVWVA